MKHTHLCSTLFYCAVLSTLALVPTPAQAGVRPQTFDQEIQPVLDSYWRIQQALAADSTEGPQAAATSIAAAASKLDAGKEHAAHDKDLPVKLRRTAKVLSKAPNLDAAREAFKQLSAPMAAWAEVAHPEGVAVLYCPMAKASWLQRKGETHNPYYGTSMSSCGEVRAGTGHAMEPMQEGTHHQP